MTLIKTRNYFFYLLLSSLVLGSVGCSDNFFSTAAPEAEGGPAGQGPDGDGGTPGTPIDPKDLPTCQEIPEVSQLESAVCLIFRDEFERTSLVSQGDFNWKSVIMDNGMTGENVDAKIEAAQKLGPLKNKNSAVLFRGREGFSTHEIYLISQPAPLENFDQVYIQFWYLPIGLEGSIQLTATNRSLPESVRIDVCTDTDQVCGIGTPLNTSQLSQLAPWQSHFPTPLALGQGNNLRQFQLGDWKLAQFYLDLSQYSVERRKSFVFRVAAAMDEGYQGNDPNALLEDGIILDDLIFVATKNNDLKK